MYKLIKSKIVVLAVMDNQTNRTENHGQKQDPHICKYLICFDGGLIDQ